MNKTPISFYKIFLFSACFFSSILDAATWDGIYQTDSLSFVTNEAHRTAIRKQFQEMIADIEAHMPAIRDAHPTTPILSEACLLLARADESVPVLMYAQRGRDKIVMASDKGLLQIPISRKIFCASDRKKYESLRFSELRADFRKAMDTHLRGLLLSDDRKLEKLLHSLQGIMDSHASRPAQKIEVTEGTGEKKPVSAAGVAAGKIAGQNKGKVEIGAKAEVGDIQQPENISTISGFFSGLADLSKTMNKDGVKEFFEDIWAGTEARREKVEGMLIHEDFSGILNTSSDADAISKYVESHIDDGEGAAVDALVCAFSKQKPNLERVSHIYPLVYTQRDPCLCCLTSIRHYLTEQLRELLEERAASITITPIVVARDVFHEKVVGKPDRALRYEYTWLSEDGASLLESTADERDVTTQDSERLIPSIYLYHMNPKDFIEAEKEGISRAAALSSAASSPAPGGVTSVPPAQAVAEHAS